MKCRIARRIGIYSIEILAFCLFSGCAVSGNRDADPRSTHKTTPQQPITQGCGPYDGNCVKDLEETMLFRRDDPRFNQAGLAADAEAYIDFFRDARREKISRLLSLYRPDSIRAILEWGGGLEKRYCVVMFADDSLYWLTWVKDDEACGKVVIDNDKLHQSIKRKIERLSRYDGGEERWIVCDRTVLFMTFYYNQMPYKTFYSDYPGRAQISAPGFPGELDDLIQTAGEMIGGTVNDFITQPENQRRNGRR